MILTALLSVIGGLLVAGLIGFLIGRDNGRKQAAPVGLVADCTAAQTHQDRDGTVVTLTLVNPRTSGWDFIALAGNSTVSVQRIEP